MANKQYNFSPQVSSNYAGELALPYVHAAVLSAPTLANGTVNVLENVKYKANIPIMSTTNLVQSATCNFAGNDTDAATVLQEAVLEVQDLMVNLQLCKKNFRTFWQGDAYTINNSVPADYADALLLYVAAEVQKAIELNIWQGDKTGAGTYALFDGIKTMWTGTASVLTNVIDAEATVIDGLSEVIALIPDALVGDYENCNIYVNPQTIDVLNIAIGALGGGYNNATSEGGISKFSGYNLVSAPGLNKGYFVIARAQDLYVGVGSADSVELAQAIDMTPLDGSDNYRITMRFAVGTQVPVPANVVMGE